MLVCGVLAVLAGCTGTPAADPDDAASPAARDLPAFSVARMLSEVPASVRTDREFELHVGDLAAASELAGVERPDSLEDVPPWLNDLLGVVEGARVHVPLTVPLAPNAPAAMVEEDLAWSVLDVDRFVSWTSLNAITTVVAGGVDESTLGDLPEAGGIRSAGEGADLEDGLENATPARPTGIPMRMVAEDGWLVSSPFTSVVQEWRAGAPTLADDETLASMAEVLDARGVYSAYAATPPVDNGLDQLPDAVVDALRLTPASFPEFDVFAIGWAMDEGEPAVSVVYHDADGRDVAVTEALVEERWTTYSFRGRPMPDLVEVDAVRTEGENVVVDLRPAGDFSPDLVASMAASEELTFWSR
jgi:hypothetical protein